MATIGTNKKGIALLKKTTSLVGGLAIVFGLWSCNSNTVYKKYTDVPDGVWERDHKIDFDFEIEDASLEYNVDIMLRNASFYPYENFWVFIHQTDPDGILDVDTLEIVLADAAGKWLGDGMGDLWDNKVPWRINYQFPKQGTYHYSIEQAMRTPKVPGILDVGLAIEKQEEEKK